MSSSSATHRHQWWLKPIGVIVLIVIGLIVVGAAGYDAYALSRLPVDYPPPGQFVTVGTAKMHYLCQGSGDPTLVLEAGFGGGALDWSLVMPKLAQHQRVCAFDRLGQDWSDAAPQSRTFSTAADELAAALQQLGIDRPIIIGHSLGGALAQIYAARYDTAGVILVEGLSADVAERVVSRLGSYQSLGLLARLGLLRPIGSLLTQPAYPESTRTQMLALRSNSRALLRLSDEGALAEQTVTTELRAAEPKVQVPMLIIAAGQSDVPGLSAGEFTSALQALAKRKTHATYVQIPGAKHYVQADHPDEVVQAIEQWQATIP